jgi:Na+/phosphate symporter
MITIYLAPLAMLVGLLMYGFAGNSKLQEIGRITFAFGLLVTLMEFAGGKIFHF